MANNQKIYPYKTDEIDVFGDSVWVFESEINEDKSIDIKPKSGYQQPEERLAKKREHCEQLANSIRSLRGSLTKDMKSDDEKVILTALVIAIIDKTAERVGNEDSADKGNFGITGLRKKHIKISGNTVYLNYKGKSGVMHEKSFSDALISSTLAQAIKNSPKRSIFVTSDGFRIKADRVNRYLSDYNISAKDLRGYHANKYIIDKLHKQEIPTEINDRKVVFKKAVRYSAARVGHAPLTLQKHYLFPELQVEYVNDGKIIDLSDFYSGGGAIAVSESSGEIHGPSHAAGGVAMVVKPSDAAIEVEGKEYYLCKSALESPWVYEFHDVTNKEVLDCIFQIEGCKYNPKIAHDNDFIVCKLAAQDKKIRDYKGTLLSIVNSMQSEYGCKTSPESEFTTGGPIGINLATDVNIFIDENGVKRFDIDDLNVILALDLFKSKTYESTADNVDISIPLNQLLVQWNGYKYYPQLTDLIVIFYTKYSLQYSLMGYVESENKIFINTNKLTQIYHDNLPAERISNSSLHTRGNKEYTREHELRIRQSIHRGLFHELQHAIQHIEGFPISRSNPTYILSELKALNQRGDMSDSDFKQWISEKDNKSYRSIEYDFYKEIPSEKEALAVEKIIDDYYKSNPVLQDGGLILDSCEDIPIFTSSISYEKPINMETETIVETIIVSEPDYKLSFENYLAKHNVNPSKKGLAEKQWINSIKTANEQGLYEVALLNDSISAKHVMDLLTSAGLHVSDDIKKLVLQEHEILIEKHKLEMSSKEKELFDLHAETVIRAKEIKKVYTKQQLADTIGGLKLLVEDKTGRDKQNLIDTIGGLELLLETMPETVEVGGYAIYKDGAVVHEIYI